MLEGAPGGIRTHDIPLKRRKVTSTTTAKIIMTQETRMRDITEAMSRKWLSNALGDLRRSNLLSYGRMRRVRRDSNPRPPA